MSENTKGKLEVKGGMNNGTYKRAVGSNNGKRYV